jgi:aryl-alcohol dehydrogenase-like predicted oxidoreductase
MRYRVLGKSGIEVSEMALGCWPFAGGAYWGAQDEVASIATVHAALDAGINFFDTAEGYEDGESERVLGRALKGQRGDAVVATKVSKQNLAPDDLVAACDRSLANLQMEYVDLYQIHWPNHDIPLADTVDALARLKEAGKVRAIGVSNFAVRDLSDILALGECVSDQLPYSLLWRVIEDKIRPLCVENDVGVICYSPLAQGLLTGRYANADEVPEGLAQSRWYAGTRPASNHDEPGIEAETFAAIAALRVIAAEIDLPMATMALAWVKAQPGVTSFLVGARNPLELSRNLPVNDAALTAEVIARLAEATDEVKTRIGPNPDMWLAPGRMR